MFRLHPAYRFPDPIMTPSSEHSSSVTHRKKFGPVWLALMAATLLVPSCAPLATVKEIKVPVAKVGNGNNNPFATLDFYLASAGAASRMLESDPQDAKALRDYDFAVSRICGIIREQKLTPWDKPIQTGSHTLAWERDFLPVWNPALYELIPTDQLEIKGKYVDQRDIVAGLGAPVVAKRIADQAHELAPTPHFYYAATAIARFEGSRCVMSLADPLESETVKFANHSYPLAADFTAPLAMMVVEMLPEKLGLPRLLHPAKFAESTRIARLEPYDPDKTVVLFVHGLGSAPTTWFPLINHLRADEKIRENYQFWFYSYPSGYPYPYSAAVLRRELDEAEKRYPLSHKMVVVGHSMGGCISRLLVTDSGRKIWNEMYTVPPEKMNLLPEHEHVLTESAIFSHRPEIGRVVFISTPHRGSDLAVQLPGRIFQRLVELPATLISIGTDQQRYEKHVNGQKKFGHFPDSLDTLDPGNDFVQALNTVPIQPDIPYHTIAGDRGRGDSPNSSDGVVPYWSSHQNGARSELIVPSHHGAHQTHEASLEVERILIENLKSSGN